MNKADNCMSENFWVLRSGDFRPERFSDCVPKNIGYPSEQIALRELREVGNLFDNEQDAVDASIAVRSELKRLEYIRQELRRYNRRRDIRLRNDVSSDRKNRALQILAKGMRDLADELQSPMRQSASDPLDENSLEHD